MLIISITLFCTLLCPTNSIAFLWNIIFGKGGHIRRVRNIETARSLNRFAILDFVSVNLYLNYKKYKLELNFEITVALFYLKFTQYQN